MRHLPSIFHLKPQVIYTTQSAIPTQPATPTQKATPTQPAPTTQPPPPCSAPIASIVNKASDTSTAQIYTKSTQFSLQARVNATCSRRVSLRFDWSVRRFADDALAGNSGTVVSLPESVITSGTELIVPKHSLLSGSYRFQFTVVQDDEKVGETTFAQDETWVEIEASILVAILKGGSARTQGKREIKAVANAGYLYMIIFYNNNTCISILFHK